MKVVRFGVTNNTLALAIYLWERGWSQAHNVHPEAILQGIVRNNSTALYVLDFMTLRYQYKL
ncbi:hypothetical protein F7734_07415 [Scytonema sp. UIC 10036]|uniref:hypothetical protein n=1 Tax=Scytonema sp. UIC 10036 TaxID=2304196 RepID=UPI0012DA9553|nr:hypothetical protein [Scytonema sp. UIC 10036]MUG92292.1 hypothetical protein [Scytonema sp. UIC 10036]